MTALYRRTAAGLAVVLLLLALSGCASSPDPQRGALIGAGAGAAAGAIAGAGVGAVVGAGVGAVIGAVNTSAPPHS